MKSLKESHPRKASLPIVVEFGILTVVSDLQSSKAPSPILVTKSGMSMDVKEVQCQNARFPMLITELGILIEAKE